MLQRFCNAKSVFLAVNASLRWLNNVSGVYLEQVSLLLIGQQGLELFFRCGPLLPIGWRTIFDILACISDSYLRLTTAHTQARW